MGSVKNTDKKTRKFISIPDMEKWALIDKLVELPKYEKSFNKIINDALDYGLPMLIKAEMEDVKSNEKYKIEEPPIGNTYPILFADSFPLAVLLSYIFH